jgi:hypothetical protein
MTEGKVQPQPGCQLTTAVTTTQTTTWHQQHSVGPGRGADRGVESRLRAYGGQAGASLGHHAGRRLPPCDRSCDRNEQHCAALGHHPANAARPRCAVRSGTSLHLLIAGLLVRVGAQPGVVAGVTQHTPRRAAAKNSQYGWNRPAAGSRSGACWRSSLAGGVYGEWVIGRSRGRRPCQGRIV